MRPECKEALRRLGALESVKWARQLHDMNLWPVCQHLHALDRKMGGAHCTFICTCPPYTFRGICYLPSIASQQTR